MLSKKLKRVTWWSRCLPVGKSTHNPLGDIHPANSHPWAENFGKGSHRYHVPFVSGIVSKEDCQQTSFHSTHEHAQATYKPPRITATLTYHHRQRVSWVGGHLWMSQESRDSCRHRRRPLEGHTHEPALPLSYSELMEKHIGSIIHKTYQLSVHRKAQGISSETLAHGIIYIPLA